MRRLVVALASLLLTATALAACGDSGSSGPSGTADQQTKVIDVSFDGDSVTPNGDVIDVAVGQPIELDVTADAPGEIHVHSTPEQEFEYKSGSSTLELDPITVPGRVTVESHTLEKTLFILQAR